MYRPYGKGKYEQRSTLDLMHAEPAVLGWESQVEFANQIEAVPAFREATSPPPMVKAIAWPPTGLFPAAFLAVQNEPLAGPSHLCLRSHAAAGISCSGHTSHSDKDLRVNFLLM